MAVTGHSWCDFAIWTEGSQPMEPRHIHVQRIYFNKMFWETEMFPALLHFMKYAFVAELLTRRVKRLRKLYTWAICVAQNASARILHLPAWGRWPEDKNNKAAMNT